jgi:hypothetical protein
LLCQILLDFLVVYLSSCNVSERSADDDLESVISFSTIQSVSLRMRQGYQSGVWELDDLDKLFDDDDGNFSDGELESSAPPPISLPSRVPAFYTSPTTANSLIGVTPTSPSTTTATSNEIQARIASHTGLQNHVNYNHNDDHANNSTTNITPLEGSIEFLDDNDELFSPVACE